MQKKCLKNYGEMQPLSSEENVMNQKIVLFLFIFISHLFADKSLYNSQEIMKKVSPAVVGIRCVIVQKEDKKNGKQARMLTYYGTGVFISKEGLLLTNITVVPRSPLKTTLFLTDGRVVSASCVGIYPRTESVLLKAQGNNFPYLELSNSKDLTVGERTYSLGNPFHSIEKDEQVAVSKGILTGMYQMSANVEDESSYNNLALETNAALNPGSDGGPLVNYRGELIGILSLAMQKERRMGIAIPIHLIVEDISEIQKFSLNPYVHEILGPEQTIATKALLKSSAIVGIEVVYSKKTKKPENKRQKSKKEKQREEIMSRPNAWSSGVIIENGDYILASALHIQSNEKINSIIIHAKMQKIEAEVIATNLPYDIALLKPKKKIKQSESFSLETQLNLEQGDWVGVCGRMESSYDITFDSGIISVINRNVKLVNVYQTQAFINYANSGGAVLNIDGNLIGVAGHIDPTSSWGLNSGISMFTGIDTIRAILKEMKKGISTSHPKLPFLGVSFWQERKIPQGAMIATITLDSAAHKAGLLPGDILISLDNTLVGEWADLVRIITSKKIGQEITFEIIRNEEKMTLSAKLGERVW